MKTFVLSTGAQKYLYFDTATTREREELSDKIKGQ